MTAKEALEQGFYIDRTCYPNMIYKGPRFNPVEVGFILTDLEQELLDALKVAQDVITVEVALFGASRELRDASEVVKQAIIIAENRYQVTYKEVQ